MSDNQIPPGYYWASPTWAAEDREIILVDERGFVERMGAEDGGKTSGFTNYVPIPPETTITEPKPTPIYATYRPEGPMHGWHLVAMGMHRNLREWEYKGETYHTTPMEYQVLATLKNPTNIAARKEIALTIRAGTSKEHLAEILKENFDFTTEGLPRLLGAPLANAAN